MGAKKPDDMRPDLSFWDIREVKESRWGRAVRTLLRGAIPLGVVAFAGGPIDQFARQAFGSNVLQQGGEAGVRDAV